MHIQAATSNYEDWLGSFCPLYSPDLEYKHEKMADPKDSFPFFRGTYYRWAELWPKNCPELDTAPRVLAIGDIHVENFGTWRDIEGRLVWGVNDFDEACHLPYTNDLVRLAASVRFASQAGPLDVKFGKACTAIESGYRANIEAGGLPFVLEERHPQLRSLAMTKERDPKRFWKKLTAVLAEPEADIPEDARSALEQLMPAQGLNCAFRHRPRIGMGSLGKPRFVALAEWHGGWVAREIKAITPPATIFVAKPEDQDGQTREQPITFMTQIVNQAIRCPDPGYRPERKWVIRRLAPRCSRIELSHLANVLDQIRLLEAMGAEVANVHLGTVGAAGTILADLDNRPPEWLEDAARSMARSLEGDWQAWRVPEKATSSKR
jgi:hypothetical protein